MVNTRVLFNMGKEEIMSKKNKITVKELKETISDSDDNARLLFSFDDEEASPPELSFPD